MRYRLLTLNQTKINKSNFIDNYKTAILHLAPHNISGVNMCPYASDGCVAACLNTAGRGRFTSIQEARIIKTQHFIHNRDGFLEQLDSEIKSFVVKCTKSGHRAVIRLNGTSDTRWERLLDLRSYNAQFYDYTKWPPHKRQDIPPNYYLTHSATESTTAYDIAQILDSGRNVAVVFADRIPESYLGYHVIDGTTHDLRFLDPPRSIVGLRALGQARSDTSGFVVPQR